MSYGVTRCTAQRVTMAANDDRVLRCELESGHEGPHRTRMPGHEPETATMAWGPGTGYLPTEMLS